MADDALHLRLDPQDSRDLQSLSSEFAQFRRADLLRQVLRVGARAVRADPSLLVSPVAASPKRSRRVAN